MNLSQYRAVRLSRLDRGPWTSIKAFATIAGKWWLSVWVLVLLSGLVAFGLTVANVQSFPTAVWVGLLLAGLVVAPAVAFHQLRIDRDTHRLLWEDREVVISLLADVEVLRAEGAALQIQGRRAAKKESISVWHGQAEDWRQRVTAKLAELHPAEAGKFTTLGIYTPRQVAGPVPLTVQHQKELDNFVRRLEILAEIRERWTG